MTMLVDIEQSYYAEAIGFTKLVAIISEANQDSQDDEAITAMLAEVEAKDVYTLGHSRRVSLYSKRLALAYEWTYNVIAIADVFDAMTCKRIYNEPSPPLAVVAYLEENSQQYDPFLVSILRRKVENGEMDDILTAFIAN